MNALKLLQASTALTVNQSQHNPITLQRSNTWLVPTPNQSPNNNTEDFLKANNMQRQTHRNLGIGLLFSMLLTPPPERSPGSRRGIPSSSRTMSQQKRRIRARQSYKVTGRK